MALQGVTTFNTRSRNMWLYKLQSTRLLRGVLGFFVDIDPLQAVSVGLYGNRELSTVFSSLISAISAISDRCTFLSISAISAFHICRAFLAISAISAFHICPGFEADMPRSEVTFDNPDKIQIRKVLVILSLHERI